MHITIFMSVSGDGNFKRVLLSFIIIFIIISINHCISILNSRSIKLLKLLLFFIN
jgi:hypothetical protein